MTTATRPLCIPPGHHLYTVSITTTWEVTEEFVVAAPTEQDARHAARHESDPDVHEADEVDTITSAAKIDLQVLTPDLAAAIARTSDIGVVYRGPGSRIPWDYEPMELIEAFMDPQLLAAAELAQKERDNGQLPLI